MLNINETTISRDGLVGEWLLDGNADDTAGTNDGTATNVTWVGADRGYVEEVASFNGSSSGILTSLNLPSTGDWTISGWINQSVIPSGVDIIIDKDRYGGFLRTQTDGKAYLYAFDGSFKNVPSINIVNDGSWHFILGIIRAGNNIELFIDGVSQGTTSIGTVQDNGNVVQIGYRSDTDYFNGNIGLPRIYNKALSQKEINNLYLEGLRKLGPTKPTTTFPKDGLVASYDYDDITVDTSGNGNDGTATSVLTQKVGQQNVGVYDGTSSIFETNVDIDETGDFSISISGIISIRTWGHFFSTFNQNTPNEWWVGSWNLTDANEGKLFFSGQGYSTYYSTTRVDDGNYHNIILTRNSSNNSLKIYIDGVLEIDETENFLQELDTVKLGTNLFNGKLGLARIYNKALSQSEIDDLYHEGLTKLSFPQYSLRNLEIGKVLEISKPQTGGTYYDQTGNGNNGTPTNVTDTSLGLNNVMSFNGASSGINIPDSSSLDITNNITICTWVASTTTATQYIVVKRTANSTDGYEFAYSGSGKAFVRFNQNSQGNTYRYDSLTDYSTDGSYDFWCVTYNGANINIYLNGVLDSTSAGVLTIGTNSNPLYIGRDNAGGYLSGNINFPKIYNRALSETEIQQLYYSSKLI